MDKNKKTNIMTERIKERIYFVSCIIEQYKKKHHKTGGEVISLFDKHNITEWLYNNYEILHTENYNNVISEINAHMH